MSADAALQLWPELRNAVQPAPIPRRTGRMTWSFNVADEWAELVQRVERDEYRLRAPAASTQGLCGPFRSIGNCLVPVKQHGDLAWIDPVLPAEDGDLVIVQWHPEKLRWIIERNRDNPDWVAMYGESPSDLAGKWLRRNGPEYWTVCRESALPLGAHPYFGGADRVLGVVRYIERRGVPLYGSGVPSVAHNIVPNAATRVFQADDISPAAVSVGTGVSSARDWLLYVEVADLASTDVIEVVAHLTAAITAIGTDPLATIAASHGATSPTDSGLGFTKDDDFVADEPVAVVGTFTGISGTRRFGVDVNISHDSAGGTSALTAFNVELQVTVVRR